jgi:glycine/sarcosine N-methyltransferase
MEFYEKFADKYDDLVSFENRVRREANFFDSLFKKYEIKTVLDCACGTGHHIIMLKQMGYNVKGSDLSPVMLEKTRVNLKKKELDVPLKVADFRALTKTFDEKLDAVICIGNSLPHLMSNDDIYKALVEMNEILNENGILVLEQRNYNKLVKEQKRFIPISFRENEVFFYVLDYYISEIIFNIININVLDRSFKVYTTEYNILKMEILEKLLKATGFQIMKYYDDYDFNKFNVEISDRVILVCQKSRS